MDANLLQPPHSDEEGQFTHSPEEREHFPSLGGGVPSPFIRDEEADVAEADVAERDEDENQTSDPEYPEHSRVSPDPPAPGLDPPAPGLDDPESGQGESDDEVIKQPIPFQMGVTPVAEERDPDDELQTWYERTEEQEPHARGSTDPAPKPYPKPRPKPIVRERSPRNLRNRQVARSIQSQPKAKVHWNLQAHGRGKECQKCWTRQFNTFDQPRKK